MRRVFSFIQSLIGLAFVLLLPAALIGPALYTEIAGLTAPGTVVAKRETIDIVTDTWTRRLYLDVRYRPTGADEDEVIDIAVDAETFDQLREETPVEVRYPPHPLLRQIRNLGVARLELQPPLATVPARMGRLFTGLVIGIAVWLMLLWAWSKSRNGLLALALAVLMIGGFLYLGSGWPAPAPPGPLLDGSATVHETHLVDRVWGGRRTPAEDAVQPYTIVQLTFIPEGATDRVVGVDMIDAGSGPVLEKGAVIPIRYSAADPRYVQIDNASRTYYWKNLRSFGIIGAIILIVLVVGWVFGRRRGARQVRRRIA